MKKYQKLSKSKSESNKPSWKHAPVWAQYLAMDNDGEWLWHEGDPVVNIYGCWGSEKNQTHASMGTDLDRTVAWTITKEERPEGIR